MKKQRKQYAPEEKVAILRRHLLEKEPISKLCDEVGLQPTVTFQRVLQMEAADGLLLPILQPEIAGNPAVVLVHLPIAFPPVVELAGGDVEPPNEPPGADLGLLRPAFGEYFGQAGLLSKCNGKPSKKGTGFE